MKTFTTPVLLAVLLQDMMVLSTAATIPQTRRQVQCATGVHMIVARASTERPGGGIIQAVADGVESQVPGSDSVAVDYPATLQNYQNSEAQGVAAMTQLIQEYAAACPGSPMVLMGYSQVWRNDYAKNNVWLTWVSRVHKS